MTIENYELVAQLYESQNSIIYRGYRRDDHQPVILKRLKRDYPTPDQAARFKREYEMLGALANVEGVIQAYALEPYQNTYLMVLEDFGGNSLARILASRPLEIARFLELSLRITDILAAIHAHKIMHKDINPSNLIWNPTTKQLKFIDFGIATTLSREQPEIRNPEVLEGTLAYISPEQTGRMNRAIDYRTDLYSLGATFYEMLTGQLPFQTDDVMELIHAHIAKMPSYPHNVNPALPPMLSKIILTLMAKTAEERYQSALGIKADLQECFDQLQLTGTIHEFSCKQIDFSDRFQIPQKLYGREQEIETVLNAFERVSQGATEVIMVTGYAGTGKSSLVQDIQKPIVAQRGYFIAGKYDQFKRNIPYSALTQSLRGLVGQLLSEPEAQIERWKTDLLLALGANGQVLIDIVPEIELLIGKQLAVSELPPAEAQIRFHYVFQNFISALARRNHPLVIFLDDLQWADSASLNLLELLVTNSDIKHLLVIGAYRDHEVHETHPLAIMQQKLQQTDIRLNPIHLTPLSVKHVNQLVADTLKHSLAKTASLADLCNQKTNGNPFFLNQLLHTLYAEQLIEFDWSRKLWKWDIDRIRQVELTDNVVTLMTGKIQKLSAATQNILQLAACIGNQFDLNTLTIVNEKSVFQTADELWEALQEGFVLPLDDIYKYIRSTTQSSFSQNPRYKFLHDRVQQASYALIKDVYKQEVHLKIGRLLLSNVTLDEQDEKIFDIVNHLNIGKALIHNQIEKTELAKFNLTAGQKAKASAACEPAFRYLQIGIELLPEESWKTQQDLTLLLYEEAAEAAYLSSNFEEMERLASVVLNQTQQLLNKVKIYEVKIQAYTAQNKMVEAINIGRQILDLLGVKLPANLNKLNIDLALLKIKFIFWRKSSQDLLKLSEMRDPYKLAAMRILKSLLSAVYLANPSLISVLLFQTLNLLIRYGNSSESAFMYAWCGAILCGTFGDIETGYRLIDLVLHLLERHDTRKIQPRVGLVLGGFMKHWKEHGKETLPLLLKSHQNGLEIGDFEYAAYAAGVYIVNSFLIGKELSVVAQEIASYNHTVGRINQRMTQRYFDIYGQAVLNLMGRNDDPVRFIGENYNEDQMLPFHFKTSDNYAIFYVYFFKTMLCYLFQKLSDAVNNAVLAKNHLYGVPGMLSVPMFVLYDSLISLAVLPSLSKAEKVRHLKIIVANQKNMKKWAHHSPMNHLHKWYLVEAERARVFGKPVKAIEYYDKAIELARKHEYINEEALAHELAAKFYLEQKKEKIARVYMRNAHYCYTKWGALAKVQHLEQTYPALLKPIYSRAGLEFSSSGTRTGFIDLTTVLNASQAISSEIILPALLQKILTLGMEHTAAKQGALLVKNEIGWRLEAQGTVDETGVKIVFPALTVLNTQSMTAEEAETRSPSLPIMLIHSVIHAKEPVVLHNAVHEGDFIHDPYIVAHQTKSILCLPFLKQDTIVGLLYLEHPSATGLFTPAHLELLRLVAPQIAISLEQANFYATLNRKVAERSEKLRIKLEEINLSTARLQENITYADRIQQALLPDLSKVKDYLPDSFFLWMPQSGIGGDMFFTDFSKDGFILAIIDCTGHGVPAAALTILASSALTQIIHDEGCHDPAETLKRMNIMVKTLLKSDKKSQYDFSDDGMDAAICFVQPQKNLLTFAGAQLPLYAVQDHTVTVIPGDSQSIGYKRSKANFTYTNHSVQLAEEMTFYLSTDGFLEQIGEDTKRRFGLSRFEMLLKDAYSKPFAQQRELFLHTFQSYKGNYKRLDDIAVAGFQANRVRDTILTPDQHDVIFEYTGMISQDVVKGIVQTIKQKLIQQQAHGTILRQVLSVVVESTQNMMHYSVKNWDGMVNIRYQGDIYTVMCKNAIENTNIATLEQKLTILRSMSKDELNSYYIAQSRKQPLQGSKGAGLGLIEMAKNAQKPLEFLLEKIDDQVSYVSLKIFV